MTRRLRPWYDQREIWISEGATRSAGSAQGGTVTIESVLGALVIGAVIGALRPARRARQAGHSDLADIVIGVVAALVGTFIVGPLRDTNGLDWVEVLVQVVLAALPWPSSPALVVVEV
jgi:uncharacterized membrane protein YeaQ/YmgE (transglycosylase-associated protein family)